VVRRDSPWWSASDIFDWLASQPSSNFGGQCLWDKLNAIQNQIALERQAFDMCSQTPLDERLFRENVRRLESAHELLIEGSREAIQEGLAQGSWLGFGYPAPDAELQLIMRRYWHFLELDWDRSSAQGHGLAFFGIQFVLPTRLDDVRAELPPRWRNLGKPKAKEASRPDKPEVDPYRSGLPGRPTIGHLIAAEFTRRADAGEVETLLSLEAVVLHEWAKRTHPSAKAPTAHTIENQIRTAFQAYRTRKNRPTK